MKRDRDPKAEKQLTEQDKPSKKQKKEDDDQFEQDEPDHESDQEIEDDGSICHYVGEKTSEHSSIDMDAYLNARDKIPSQDDEDGDEDDDDDSESEYDEEGEDQDDNEASETPPQSNKKK